MKSGWIKHKGTEIFHIDFSNFQVDREAFEDELEAVASIVTRTKAETVLGLVDIRDTVLSIAMTVIVKGYARRMGPHIRRAAVIIGKNTRSKRSILNSIAWAGGRELVFFEDIEEAKDWLVDNKA